MVVTQENIRDGINRCMDARGLPRVNEKVLWNQLGMPDPDVFAAALAEAVRSGMIQRDDFWVWLGTAKDSR